MQLNTNASLLKERAMSPPGYITGYIVNLREKPLALMDLGSGADPKFLKEGGGHEPRKCLSSSLERVDFRLKGIVPVSHQGINMHK